MNTKRPGSTAATREHPAAGVELELITSLCGSGDCPTIYRTNRGTLVVQGYVVDAAQVGIDLPERERLVEIPAELLVAAWE